MLITAHSVAALGYSGIADLDAAERHRRAGLALAQEAGNKHAEGQALAQLASIEMKQGRLEEAIRHCEEAAATHPSAVRLANITRGEALRLAGRYEEAREALDTARRSQPLPQPDMERRSQGTSDLGFAWLEAEAGNTALAMEFVQKARPVLASDAKLSLWCAATASWIHAQLGEAEEATRLIWEVQTYAPEFSADRSTQSLCRSYLARAYFHLGDLPRACEHWEAYFQTYPDPVFRPWALYHYGDCLDTMDKVPQAVLVWQQALDLNLPTLHSQLCRRRLHEMGAAGIAPPPA
jgi:tetratricopeptide (TPR) repeat protein